MDMFWLKNLKTDESQGQWALPYGDLMSLLLAVFVMIAAMSELRDDKQFISIARGVRSAFGFSQLESSTTLSGMLVNAQPTLLERLEQMCMGQPSKTSLRGSRDEVLSDCEMVAHPDRLMIRISGEAAFESFSAEPSERAERALKRLADYLAEGHAELEIRGHCATQVLPADVPFRDAWDLSYERARRVARIFEQAGIARDRLFVSAWADRDPLVAPALPDALAESDGGGETPAANRRIEMIVHAVPTAEYVNQEIAEKERGNNG